MFANRNVIAWLLLVTSFGLHVLDEAIGGFLPFWNRFVTDTRSQLGFFPAPKFSFDVWLSGLVVAIILGYCMTPLVARGGKVIRVTTLVLGIIMIVNAFGHFLGSYYFGEIIPGVWSSPFLLLAAIFVTFQGIKGDWKDTKRRLGDDPSQLSSN